MPSPIAEPSIEVTPKTMVVALLTRASSAFFASASENAFSSTGIFAISAISRMVRRRMPGRIEFDKLLVISTLLFLSLIHI